MSGPNDDRRRDGWPDEAPRQRRQVPWPSGQARNRRRWRDFREAYPRIVTAMTLGLGLLLIVDVALGVAAWRYSRQTAAAQQGMTGLERERSDALMAAEKDRMALLLALVRQQSVQDRRLNLSVSLDESTMDLQREGAQLRHMKVALGPEAAVGAEPDVVRLVPPRGRRQLVRVVGGDFEWAPPRWVFAHRGLAAPPAAERSVTGGLGDLALVLDDGTVIYTLPARGPLSDRDYVMPGTVRAQLEDLLAIRENLTPGLPVYFH
jgi:hypothetical protein